MSCFVMSCHVIWCHVIWCHMMSYHVMSCHLMYYDVMWYDVMWCDVMWCDVIWCDVMWCDVNLWLFLLHHVFWYTASSRCRHLMLHVLNELINAQPWSLYCEHGPSLVTSSWMYSQVHCCVHVISVDCIDTFMLLILNPMRGRTKSHKLLTKEKNELHEK